MTEKLNTKPFYNFQIPNDWKLERLGNYGTTYAGLSGKTKEDFGHGKPYIPYLNIFNYAIIKDGEFDYVNVNLDETQSLVENGDLFFTTSSETPEEVGMCSAYDGNEKELYLNSFSFGFRPKNKNEISSTFLALLFRSAVGRRIIYKLAQGATRYNISKTNLLKEKFPLPTLPEQKAIAYILSLMDTAINNNNLLIAKNELQKKWLMQNLLTGRKRLTGFKGKWIEYQVSQLFQTVDRYVKWNDDEKYNLVSIRRRNGGMFFREPLYGSKIEVKKLKEIKSDDFLISKRQVSHGAWAIVTKEFENGKVSDEYDCLAFQDEKKVSSNFWKWFCQLPVLTHYAYVDSNGVHIEKSIFDYNQFKRRIVNIPGTLSEQTAIAQVLQAADKEIQLLKTKTEKLRKQKKGIMQVLLTGKKRLKIKNAD